MRRGKKRTVADESEKLGEKSQKISVCVEGGAGGCINPQRVYMLLKNWSNPSQTFRECLLICR